MKSLAEIKSQLTAGKFEFYLSQRRKGAKGFYPIVMSYLSLSQVIESRGFSRETTEKIRLLLHGENSPVRSISVDVFSSDEAV